MSQSKSNHRSPKIFKELNDNQLSIEKVIYFEAKVNYTILYTENQTFTSSKTLKSFEALLCKKSFVRIHKSYIVNSAFVEKAKFDSLGGSIQLSNGNVLDIARRRVNTVNERLKKMNLVE